MADTFTLIVNFRGLCTHFHNNILHTVPHRVVFANASGVIPGLLAIGTTDPAAWQSYYLMPHVMSMKMLDPDAASVFATNGLIDDTGYVFSSIRLSVVNSIDTELTYPGDSFTRLVHSLSTAVENYEYSDDVVLNGRASGYFDIRDGAITAVDDGKAARVIATFQTSGAPQLLIQALHPDGHPTTATVVTLPVTTVPNGFESTMLIGNIGASCDFGSFDYLLHLLTSKAGIPRFIPAPLPGMGQDDCDPVQESFKELVEHGFPRRMPPIAKFDTFASCADSRYP